MVQKVLIKRTLTPNQPPPALDPGELALEMASVPPKLWGGVPIAVDPAGMVLLNPPSAPVDLSGYLPLAGGTMTGPIISVTGDAINGAAGTTRSLFGLTTGVNRWEMRLGDELAEGGGNVGSGFQLISYDDTGAELARAFYLYRNGNAFFSGLVTSGAGTFISRAQPGADAAFTLLDDLGAVQGGVSWVRNKDSIAISNGPTVTLNNTIQLGSTGLVNAGSGILCRTGVTGVYGVNSYNFNWNSTALECWIDTFNMGLVTIVSDYRIKKDVADLPVMWDTVKALRPISYTQAEYGPTTTNKDGEEVALFVADDIERWGFIAHELQETLIPSAASAEKDAPNAIQSPNPFTLLAALTKVLQEAMGRIETLENIVATLTGA